MEHQLAMSFTAQSAQEVQDAIFRQMSAERKIKLASDFWRLARAIAHQRSALLFDRKRSMNISREDGEDDYNIV